MNILNKFFFILIFFFFSNQVLAENNIFYIDVDYIIKNSNKGKSIISQLEKINQANINKFQKEQTKLVDLENDIKLKKNVINEEELKKKIKNFNDMINSFNEEKKKINNEFKKKRDMELKNFFSQIEELVKVYVKEKSIDILIDKKNIFIGKSSYDVTSNVLKIINENIK